MTFTLFLAVAVGALVGAPSRFLLDRFISERIESDLPWGTFAINVSGSLLLGLLTGMTLAGHLHALPQALLGTGFCGAYTTFSTFTYESVQLFEEGRIFEALANAIVSLVVGLVGATAGVSLGLVL